MRGQVYSDMQYERPHTHARPHTLSHTFWCPEPAHLVECAELGLKMRRPGVQRHAVRAPKHTHTHARAHPFTHRPVP